MRFLQKSYVYTLSIVLLLQSCGIESYDYLYPPRENSSSTTSTTRTFLHDTDNDIEGFRGYQIYYKLYMGPSASVLPDSAISEASSIESYRSTGYPDTVIAKMETLGYRAIVPLGINPVPVVSITDASKEAQVDINLIKETLTLNVDGVEDIYDIRRSTYDTKGENRSFLAIDPIDDDVSTISGGDNMWIRVYAFAYGLNSSFSAFYSLPTVVADTIYITSR